jgi:hypothetical protein
VLPIREQVKTVFFAGLDVAATYLRRLAERRQWKITIPKVSRYVPDFKTGIHHFCIHAGGRAVIDGIEKNLQLSREDTEPSRLTLYHYGEPARVDVCVVCVLCVLLCVVVCVVVCCCVSCVLRVFLCVVCVLCGVHLLVCACLECAVTGRNDVVCFPGNTSSSSIWYEMRFVEEKVGPRAIRKGQRVLQIAFGSGFKCNSAVWVRLR